MVYQDIFCDRINLLKPTDEDASDLWTIRINEAVNFYIHRKGPQHVHEIGKFIENLNLSIEANNSYYWCISTKKKRKIIGTICLWNFSKDKNTAEVGYELLPHFQGKGLMSEALKAILDFGFNKLNLTHIEAVTHWKNKKSNNLLLKSGFVQNNNRVDESNKNHRVFELYREDFLF